MKRKFAAFGATLLLVLAVVGFSGAPKEASTQPAQAWYYSSCTATGMNGVKYCYKICGAMEKYWTPYCGQWEPVNVWNA